jgi:hypothetical protein
VISASSAVITYARGRAARTQTHMGIREKLNNNPKVAVSVGIAALVLGVVFAAQALTHRGGGGPSEEAFFTTDDGKTWFAESASNLPPFQHEGKEAVRAYVYECNGKQFVNHMERLTPERRKFMEALVAAQRAGQQPPAASPAVAEGQQVKRPGGKEWVSINHFIKAGPVLQARCPDGKGEALPVVP